MRRDKRDLLKAVSHPDIFFEVVTGYKPEKFQSELLMAIVGRHPRQHFITIGLGARGSGKSIVLACGCAYLMITEPGCIVPLIAPGMRQSQMLLRMVSDMIGNLPIKPGRITSAKQELELSNKSRAICLPIGVESEELEKQSNVRGTHSQVALCDEISGIPADIIRAGILPIVLPTGGHIVAAGSPAGERGWVFDVWMSGECCRIHAPAKEIRHLPQETLESLKKSMTEDEIKREIDALFASDQEQCFHLSGFTDIYTGVEAIEL
jgi:hypothetical protein